MAEVFTFRCGFRPDDRLAVYIYEDGDVGFGINGGVGVIFNDIEDMRKLRKILKAGIKRHKLYQGEESDD